MASNLCPYCYTPNQPSVKFCRGCGKALIQPEQLATAPPEDVVACPNCGRPNRSGARFCTSCGKPLATLSTEPSPPPAPVQPSIVRQVDFNVQGNISGQVAIGDFNYQVQIGNVYGGVVNLPPAPIPAPRPVQTPAHILPTDFPGLLGRKTEINQAAAAIQSGLPVEFSGEDGIGKTSLLHYLAHHLITQPDGVLWDSIPGRPVEDVLQFLYENFYTSDVLYQPSEAQVLQGLQDKHALVLLDNVTQTRQDMERLLDAAPGCAFILASAERRLWRNGHAETLQGLDPQEALPLVERELGRPLDPTERSAALVLCMAYGGHPLHILQAVDRAGRAGLSLSEVARQAQPQAPGQTIEEQALSRLSNVERLVLSALAFLGSIPVGVAHLAEVTGLANVAHVLSSLQSQRLVQSHSPRYSLTGNLAVVLQQQSDLSAWGERYLDHFAAWAESQTSPQAIIEEMDALQKVLAWATSSGLWSKALRLARAIESALALGLRWGAWAQALEWGLQAARALGDRSAEGWALHQIGTRALCQGQTDAARTALTTALQIRQALGDKAAIAVTQHNLNLLAGPLTPPRRSAKPSPKTVPAMIAVVTLAIIAVAVFLTWDYFCRDGRCRLPAQAPPFTAVPPATVPYPLSTPTQPPTVTGTQLPTITQPPTETTPPVSGLADLVVSEFQVSSPPWYKNSQDVIMIPVHIVVENRGETPAGPFKVGVRADPDGSPPARMVIPAGEGQIPFSNESLPQGSSISFDALVVVSGSLQTQAIALTAIADFCSDEPDINQKHCRVVEITEDNNTYTIHDLVLPPRTIPLVCVTFDDPDLSPGTIYRVNQMITSQGVTLAIQPFTWSSGTPTADGLASLDNQPSFNSQVLSLNNVNLSYPINGSLPGLTLDYFYSGGNINIEINGEPHWEFHNPSEMDGVAIRGVKISVRIDVDITNRGSIHLDGKVSEFSIGGQELWVDNICPRLP